MLSVQRSKNPFLGFPGGSDGKESFSNEQYQRKQNKVTQSGTYFSLKVPNEMVKKQL